MASEAAIQNEILIAFGSRPSLRLWRQNSGLLYAPGPGGTVRRIRASVPGAADLTGVRLPGGQRIEIEVKAALGRQTADQKAFQKMIESFGGKYILARCVEDVERAL